MNRRAFLSSMGISLIQTAMAAGVGLAGEKVAPAPRSEEHTSELQSL